MFQLPILRWDEIAEYFITDKQGISSKSRKYSLLKFVPFVESFIINIISMDHLAVYYELVNVESATHCKSVMAAKIEIRNDKIGIKPGFLIPF